MNFLKTKLFKKSEGKTKESRFLKKTGEKLFQRFFGMKKNKEERIQETRYKDTNKLEIKKFKLKIEKPSQPPFMKGRGLVDESFSEKSSYLNGSSPFREGGPRGFLNDEKSTIINQQSTKKSLNRFLQITNYKLQITVALLLVLLPATFFFLQNKSQDSNNPITVSSINSQEQFEIKKTKDSLALTSENSSITLNQIETEKKDFEIYSHPPKATNLKTQVVYFDDSDLNYQQAEITLKKEKQF